MLASEAPAVHRAVFSGGDHESKRRWAEASIVRFGSSDLTHVGGLTAPACPSLEIDLLTELEHDLRQSLT